MLLNSPSSFLEHLTLPGGSVNEMGGHTFGVSHTEWLLLRTNWVAVGSRVLGNILKHESEFGWCHCPSFLLFSPQEVGNTIQFLLQGRCDNLVQLLVRDCWYTEKRE